MYMYCTVHSNNHFDTHDMKCILIHCTVLYIQITVSTLKTCSLPFWSLLCFSLLVRIKFSTSLSSSVCSSSSSTSSSNTMSIPTTCPSSYQLAAPCGSLLIYNEYLILYNEPFRHSIMHIITLYCTVH